MVCPATDARSLLVTEAEGQISRFFEFEDVVALLLITLLCKGLRHANHFQGFFPQIVCLLGVEREDLESNIRFGNKYCRYTLNAELLERLKPMVSVGGPIPLVLPNYNDGI